MTGWSLTWEGLECQYKEFGLYPEDPGEILDGFKQTRVRSSLVAWWVKDLVLSLLWLGSLLWRRFSPWPRTFCMLQAQPKQNKSDKCHDQI